MNFQHFMGYRNIAGKIMDHPLRQNAKAKVVREYKWDTFYLFILFTYWFQHKHFYFLKCILILSFDVLLPKSVRLSVRPTFRHT